jgi:serine O-acetyltransferase
MFAHLQQDIARNLCDYGPQSALRRVLLCLTLNSIHALVLIRLQLWCARHGLPSLFASKLLFWFFKIEISSKATIGPGLRLPHPMGIIVAPHSFIGSNCDLYADVRLVLSHGRKQGPHLEDGVFMGDGAKAVGAVRIGAKAVIGVSAVVTRDIPPNAVAAGVPARVLTSHQPTS